MGDQKVLDGMIKDGLWDPYDNVHMGNCGEKCAKEFSISRQEQDDFAINSIRKVRKKRNANGKQEGKDQSKDQQARNALMTNLYHQIPNLLYVDSNSALSEHSFAAVGNSRFIDQFSLALSFSLSHHHLFFFSVSL